MAEDTLPEVEKRKNLQAYNTLGVQAHATRFISIESQKQLEELLQNPSYKKENIFVLGGGSNVLFVDDFDGLILHMDIKGIRKVDEDEDHVWVRAGAGEVWHDLVLHCVEKGWGGIENLSLIPGTVGAAPIQNIGAYGVELKDVFDSLEAVNLETGAARTFSRQECRFGYRDSIFKNTLKGQFAITSVTLRLDKQPELNTSYGAIQSKLEEKEILEPGIKDISDIVIDIRRSKLPDPKALGNAGSFFKNPVISKQKHEVLKEQHPNIPGYTVDKDSVKVPAGWLIEQTGWKGKKLGQAGTYQNQALVIVNHGGATGKEIISLAEKVKKSVKERFDISLDTEVNIIG